MKLIKNYVVTFMALLCTGMSYGMATQSAGPSTDSAQATACSECATWVLDEYKDRIQGSKLIDPTATKPQHRKHVLLNGWALDQLYDIALEAKKLMKAAVPHGPYKVFSLGQSCAWLMEMMQWQDAFSGEFNVQYGFIAFSSSLYEWKDEDNRFVFRGLFGDQAKQYPRGLERYQHYLSTLKLGEDGHLFILEAPHRMQGLWHFLDVAEKYLPRDHTIFLVNEAYQRAYKVPNQLSMLPYGDLRIPKLIVPLANSDDFDDRLVMRYPYHQWHEKNPLSFKISESAQLLREIVNAYVECRARSSSGLLIP